MKKVIVAILALTMSSSAFADCQDAYRQASKRRDIRNEVIVGVAYVATGAGALVLSTGTAAGLLLLGNELILVGAWPTTDFKRQGDKLYMNNFDRELAVFDGATRGESNRSLEKILRKTERKMKTELTLAQIVHAEELLASGFESELFCPVTKTRANGTKKRAVFNRGALVDYLAQNL